MLAEFVQIVGLLAAFSSERNADKSADLAEFFEWLANHNHEVLRRLIESNHATAIGIKAMLGRGIDDITEKLNDISSQLATLGTRTEGIRDLSISYASSMLSTQALEILRTMETHKAQSFILLEMLNGPTELMMIPSGQLTVTETRFLHDDLQLLSSLGFLQAGYNSSGRPQYRATRAGSNYIKGSE